MSKILALVAAFTTQSVLAACPGGMMHIHDLNLSSDGMLTRTVTVEKKSDAQRANSSATPKYVTVVRDRIKLERDDEITMNAALEMVDASVIVNIKVNDQKRDEKGVFSTTYKVVQTDIASFAGMEQVSKKAFLAKVSSNYVGNGTYSRGCGEVVMTALDNLDDEAN